MEKLVEMNPDDLFVTGTQIDGVLILERGAFKDERGIFCRLLCSSLISKKIGSINFVQSNLSYNEERGTLRGLHSQKYPFEEYKLVTCIKGSIYDVAVDMRKESNTYLHHIGIVLDTPQKSILIPPFMLHGYQTLESETIVHYNVSNKYNKEHEVSHNALDPALKIRWPLEPGCMSTKDKNAPQLET